MLRYSISLLLVFVTISFHYECFRLFLLIMSGDELVPPATGSGQQPPTPLVTSAPPGIVTQPGLVSTAGQGSVSTTAQSSVIASNSGVQGSGPIATTHTTMSVVSTPTAGIQPDVLQACSSQVSSPPPSRWLICSRSWLLSLLEEA